jgi:hypothetical protein
MVRRKVDCYRTVNAEIDVNVIVAGPNSALFRGSSMTRYFTSAPKGFQSLVNRLVR